MEPTARTEKDNDTTFLKVVGVGDYCKRVWGVDVETRHFEALIDLSLLPVFGLGPHRVVLRNDLRELLPVLLGMSTPDAVDILAGNLFSEGLALSRNCRIELTAVGKVDPTFCVATRNLISVAQQSEGQLPSASLTLSYFPPTRISTTSPAVSQHVAEQKARARQVQILEASDFAGSAHYMGSKRLLTGFVVEAISEFVPPGGVVVDLMCGSGAASRAFSRIWTTVASDLQEFCRLLALVQGGGFTKQRAQALLADILPKARMHAGDLREILSEFIDVEDKLLHGDIGPALLDGYRRFLTLLPTYPDERGISSWHPKAEVERRKGDPKLYPYCLFSAYFANVFFGLRQCVEIDSLRFAIDQLKDEEERRWALGALITTISALGTTHAAHFAQPRIKDVESVGLDDLPKLIEQRAYSVIHEFTVRLMNLSEESASVTNAIEIIPGPWEAAILQLDLALKNKSVLVYLDAPYKREEYSRYYHVLETLVSYSYPESWGKGRLPTKGSRERPKSEFFTRSQENINRSFVQLITSILRRGWRCAWSYASSGSADIVAVLEQVKAEIPCGIKSFATPYEHKSQGKGRSAKRVTEYVVVIVPEQTSNRVGGNSNVG